VVEEYRTTNLSLAGYFACEGFYPASIQVGPEMRSRKGAFIYTFVYENDIAEQVSNLEKLYFSNQAKVNPKIFEAEKQALKDMITTREETIKE
jgi:hypothetical protein